MRPRLRFPLLALAALGLAGAPTPCRAQSRTALRAAAAPQARPAPTRVAPRAVLGGGPPSYATYAATGTLVGAGVGLAIGFVSYNRSRCNDCWTPDALVPVAGAVAGAVLGFAVGSLVYAGARGDWERRRAGGAR
jgi:hypothetical protein